MLLFILVCAMQRRKNASNREGDSAERKEIELFILENSDFFVIGHFSSLLLIFFRALVDIDQDCEYTPNRRTRRLHLC